MAPLYPPNYALLRPRTHTPSIVPMLMERYNSTLAAQSLTLSEHHQALIADFLATLVARDNLSETILPPADLLTTSIPHSLHISTGLSVTRSLAAAIVNAQHSVLFSTCFWARSESRDIIASALRGLSQRVEASGGNKVTVRIGFSSTSAAQKLFHTSSPRGQIHLPDRWAMLGLPGPEELNGLDIRVKSIFYLPFSVLHGKYCIIDGAMLFLPSANVSWEVWMEQCTVFSGPIVAVFTEFWRTIWGEHSDSDAPPPEPAPTQVEGGPQYPTIFLPQPHHRNPSFAPSLPSPLPCCLPRRRRPAPPQTPQNTFLLYTLESARSSVYLQSPNLTSRPLLHALKSALARGVTVDVVTCRRMMVAEQLLTTAASLTTEGGVASLVRCSGALGVWYYAGAAPPPSRRDEEGEDESSSISPLAATAVQSHVKALVVDGEITVLGSANADRASWYTSQEVNVAVFGAEFAVAVRKALVGALGGRVERVIGAAELRDVAG